MAFKLKLKVINIFKSLSIIGLSFAISLAVSLKSPPMIIKLPIPLVFARQKSEKIEKPLTITDKVKLDRLVMLFLFTLAVATAVYFA